MQIEFCRIHLEAMSRTLVENTLVFENSAAKKPSRRNEQSRDANRRSPKLSEGDEQRKGMNGKSPKPSAKEQSKDANGILQNPSGGDEQNLAANVLYKERLRRLRESVHI